VGHNAARGAQRTIDVGGADTQLLREHIMGFCSFFL
jgi:hypothetical protein